MKTMPTSGLYPPPARLPARPMDSHKGDFGAVGILGGAPGMAGAALLAGRAALACGAGRVYVGLLDARVAVDAGTPELMLAAPERLLALPRPACLVAGPGLGLAAAAREWLRAVLPLEHAVLVDADALNLLAGDDALLALLRARAAPSLITPHPGEAARLLGETPAAVQAERPAALRRLQRLTGACVVLKGAHSLVGSAEDEVWRNETGNPGMAAPGMGDVLAGIIAALLAQGMSAFDAARTGVWLHGAAGDAAVRAGLGPVGLAASELIPHARRLLNQYLVTD